jgi:hypothetical protein
MNNSTYSSPEQEHIENIIRQYEHREIFVLLELAVWKARLGKISHELLLQDPHVRKNARVESGVDVVIRNVLPFL